MTPISAARAKGKPEKMELMAVVDEEKEVGSTAVGSAEEDRFTTASPAAPASLRQVYQLSNRYREKNREKKKAVEKDDAEAEDSSLPSPYSAGQDDGRAAKKAKHTSDSEFLAAVGWAGEGGESQPAGRHEEAPRVNRFEDALRSGGPSHSQYGGRRQQQSGGGNSRGFGTGFSGAFGGGGSRGRGGGDRRGERGTRRGSGRSSTFGSSFK
uniref:Uncharacterized protein n=2 Tax=Palpitomonas bilix TaxID=652834 RepID=A0A7S3GE19_9EUKA|mmetsp:Transcript_45221/g.117049  ORF Transcript_45221/g.117049 Transcript_45221/m.117049 type:complete len:211 (+) Transcript_45221:84-716(+)